MALKFRLFSEQKNRSSYLFGGRQVRQFQKYYKDLNARIEKFTKLSKWTLSLSAILVMEFPSEWEYIKTLPEPL